MSLCTIKRKLKLYYAGELLWRISFLRFRICGSYTGPIPNYPQGHRGFLKAYEERGNRKFYYKLSNYDSYRGVFGHECVNELVVSRLLDILQVEHLRYQLLHARLYIDGKEIETYITCTENFRKENERKMSLDIYYELHKQESESPLDFCIRMGWKTYVYQMLVVDYLICNRDRHGANIELLVDEKGMSVLHRCLIMGCP